MSGWTGGGPYREGPSFLICPRCGEILDRAFDDVLACLRCKGMFITPPTAGLAFDDPAWPKDTSAMWWKSSLECPVCANAGATTIMAAQTLEGTVIDRCVAHGLWLDAGELARLTHTTGDELAFLRSKIRGEGVDGNELDTKREQLRRDVEARRKSAELQEAWRASERARQIEDADRRHEAERRATEEQKRIAAAWAAPRAPGALFDPAVPEPKAEPGEPRKLMEPPKVEPPQPVPSQPRPYAPQLTAREELERKIWLDEQRASLAAAIGTLEHELIDARAKVREVEGKLATERARLRMLVEDGR